MVLALDVGEEEKSIIETVPLTEETIPPLIASARNHEVGSHGGLLASIRHANNHDVVELTKKDLEWTGPVYTLETSVADTVIRDGCTIGHIVLGPDRIWMVPQLNSVMSILIFMNTFTLWFVFTVWSLLDGDYPLWAAIFSTIPGTAFSVWWLFACNVDLMKIAAPNFEIYYVWIHFIIAVFLLMDMCDWTHRSIPFFFILPSSFAAAFNDSTPALFRRIGVMIWVMSVCCWVFFGSSVYFGWFDEIRTRQVTRESGNRTLVNFNTGSYFMSVAGTLTLFCMKNVFNAVFRSKYYLMVKGAVYAEHSEAFVECDAETGAVVVISPRAHNKAAMDFELGNLSAKATPAATPKATKPPAEEPQPESLV